MHDAESGLQIRAQNFSSGKTMDSEYQRSGKTDCVFSRPGCDQPVSCAIYEEFSRDSRT
jgi:hypothetical protein